MHGSWMVKRIMKLHDEILAYYRAASTITSYLISHSLFWPDGMPSLRCFFFFNYSSSRLVRRWYYLWANNIACLTISINCHYIVCNLQVSILGIHIDFERLPCPRNEQALKWKQAFAFNAHGEKQINCLLDCHTWKHNIMLTQRLCYTIVNKWWIEFSANNIFEVIFRTYFCDGTITQSNHLLARYLRAYIFAWFDMQSTKQ